ncbi:MAG: hypothetical protein ACD_42C00350G0003 [uncultured bacterium]|nr:MAG: hypothetical protein ACD_42C00350G0003 [uncultured bacterium]OGT25510.1 MAG: nucleoside-diphosphate sugar epimerase [Gammaproteobacteria bacterium RIFCSPHIGHO2_02_FULL_42_43]OGT28424.1 MAG: nucleoside-diphosphate sugar epimerase [Gammaproteobacteria bacterium RIFCSPHIGHO2_01_FULL_42_8]OGT51463.1 MAG: nucleoside-diphosphate sugar epimerase [Gammaproteobacteria bacterium RIFCSPHIGHO2_12_FULL_41_25]OGT62164.1 MAG: nucleoside-diphosphate sugar epimerase [Gammaproteobacteria bacterium RIFCSP
MKIIVTGALGHIGSYLIRNLPEVFSHPNIIMIDNLMTQRYTSLFNLPKTAQYQFIEVDITSDKMDLKSIFKNADVVIHLAAITNAAASFENANEVERVNFNATQKVADVCVATNVAMIMASSTSVYGTQEKQVDENCSFDELKPQSPYAETKLREEKYIQEQYMKNNLRAIIFRFGTIFGVSPGMRFHTAVNKFCWQAVMNEPITVWKTAYHQKRPYLALNDALSAITMMIKQNHFDGRVYNVVSVNATVADVVKSIQQYIPDLQIQFVENKIMNQLSYEVLNTRLNAMGFKPRGELKSGVLDTLQLLCHTSSTVNTF